eukprot:Hpha_TRINITY_DN26111_c0_g1::TRINITY_DN26111_c0_g1_i1::g.155439::m.155439/K17981/MTFP1, MTP18; mitochondrial fission process protein 1
MSHGHDDGGGLLVMRTADTVNAETSRFAGYGAGIARVPRYLAYASDLGESLRPVVARSVVWSAYGISLGYCGNEIFECYKREIQAQRPSSVVNFQTCREAMFQALASIILPGLTLHTAVHRFQTLLAKQSPFVVRWGPTFGGFCLIPFLPLMDEPVAHAMDTLLMPLNPSSSSCA